MINLIISGCNGKMGGVVSKLALLNDSVRVVCGFDVNTDKTHGYDVYDDLSNYDGKADVIIDFSHPMLTERALSYARETHTPIVVATTGLSEEQKALMKEVSKSTAVFFSANMSLGVNLLIELAKSAAKVLENKFDIEIIEKHHNRKIDAPSGTALMVADAINEVLESKKEYVYDRHSVHKKRSESEIGIHTVRGGTIVGEHEVIFAGNDEIIEIKHTATSREIFAVGAISAAKFICGKDKGIYSMKDLLDINL